jgi:hypothetical protein
LIVGIPEGLPANGLCLEKAMGWADGMAEVSRSVPILKKRQLIETQ